MCRGVLMPLPDLLYGHQRLAEVPVPHLCISSPSDVRKMDLKGQAELLWWLWEGMWVRQRLLPRLVSALELIGLIEEPSLPALVLHFNFRKLSSAVSRQLL